MQGIASEHRDGFAVHHMHRGAPATFVVIVHARQVIVDERVGVNQLDRRGDRQRVGRMASDSLAGRIEDCDSTFIVTSDEGVRGGKNIPLKISGSLDDPSVRPDLGKLIGDEVGDFLKKQLGLGKDKDKDQGEDGAEGEEKDDGNDLEDALKNLLGK